VHTSTGRSTEVCHLYLCRAVNGDQGSRPEPTEFIQVLELPFGEALGEVQSGRITDAATVLGLLWAADGGTYRLHQFPVSEAEAGWRTDHFATDYRALLRLDLAPALHHAGLGGSQWHEPGASGYYQPIVTARSPRDGTA